MGGGLREGRGWVTLSPSAVTWLQGSHAGAEAGSPSLVDNE